MLQCSFVGKDIHSKESLEISKIEISDEIL